MHFIEKNGKVSRISFSKQTGLSIGKVNYCIKALIDIGFVIKKNKNTIDLSIASIHN